ncbi:MAG: 1-(5-phosphoribosyl)-5-[(5-phosphoribosylamino)methylideneamino]imidazole-4-carboxamide isomerase [Lentisphaerae bacterium]|nr:1-(5-phosphoribosyl)-5-[(5-phosphoribosylamino)methylideneamino]imidazole-4-carboxamide isomerase [Lentisphaerota bacterium]
MLPAIDLKGGKCVRLRQGIAEDETVYSENPLDMALEWQRQGARWLHVVDLDGAFTGKPAHSDVISQITKTLDIPVEVGGGLRTEADIRQLVNAGVTRAIIGTMACESPDNLSRLVDLFGDNVAVGIDARGGVAQVKGWTEATGIKATELAVIMNNAGVKTVIYTDVATDGMMRGPNVPETAAMCKAFNGEVIASGGITRVSDVTALRELNAPNLAGGIVGKALYERQVTLADLIQAGDA